MGTLADQLQLIGLLGLGMNVPAQLFLLALQADAYRRYRHVSFARLVVASVLLIGSTLIWCLPMMLPFAVSARMQVAVGWIGLALSAVGMGVAIWGAATLFRRYGQLVAASESAGR